MQSDKTGRDEVHRLATEVARLANESGFEADTKEYLTVLAINQCRFDGKCNADVTAEVKNLFKLVKAEEQDAIVALINDDAAAISYQSLAQYRSALLQAIRARKDK